ncbi:hypothetical protein ED733_006384 [Metarhizium rileyi]|uniref:Uncharacterized protein n=1 Tax=Metarhizium rileyi (strain RCEF 4871) TaxID=1649241 RepID=A0A5C6GP03_METRR|nr:hypothetical protein ED733_006384 [Metarhizium rileyi]
MSSPDPLNDLTMADVASVPPSSVTHRVTRSQSSQRVLSRGSSPRKQMFELQVGDRMSPQRLLVTVETDGQQQETSVGSNAKRKLFQSPASNLSTPARRLRGRTTTTTVPLRESIEEDGDDAITPKARGRQRKSNGTPMPSAGTKRRAGTPVRRTPRRLRTLTSADGEEPSSEASDGAKEEASVRATSTPRRRNLRSRKPPGPAPSSDVGTDNTPRPSTARRGRRRRQALAPDELLELADEVGDIKLDTTQLPPVTSEDEVDLVRAPSESTDDGSLDAPAPAPAPGPASAMPSSPSPNYAPTAAEPDSDIWIGSISKEVTPRASNGPPRDMVLESSPRFPSTGHLEVQPDPIEIPKEGYYGDYGYENLGGYGSDRSSIDEPLEAEDHATTAAPSGFDTIAQGEDFSMIFMHSIPSLQADFNSSVHPVVHDELGDETNLIINNTLESLRQTDHDDPEEEDDAVDAIQPVDAQLVEEVPVEKELVEGEPAEEVIERETRPVRQSASPSRPSSRWSRSPRKTVDSSPLRHRVLKYNALHTRELPAAQTIQSDRIRSSPLSDRSLGIAGRLEEEVSHSYEDSFSEIPEAVLTAATPRRPQGSANYDDLEDEVDQVKIVDSADDDNDDAMLAEDQLQEDGPVEVEEVAVWQDEQDVQYPKLPQHREEPGGDEANELDQPEHRNIEGPSEEEDDVGEMEDEPYYDEEQSSRQDQQQEYEGDEEMEEDGMVQEDEAGSESEPEPTPRQHQVLPPEVDNDEVQEEEDEYDQNGLDDAELADLDAGNGRAMMKQTADTPREDNEEEGVDDMEAMAEDVVSPQPHEEDQEYPDEELVNEIDGDEDYEIVDEPAVIAASIASTAAQPDSARLPTPGETPPQAESEEAIDVADKSVRGSRPPSGLHSSPRLPAPFRAVSIPTVEEPREVEEPEEEEDEEMQDELPANEGQNPEGDLFVPDSRQEPATSEVTRQSVGATPPHQISSPVQEPASLQHETLADKTARPYLSTIIRAGRVLQSVTSDPPSPEGREKQLGSPFRRSVSKDSWNGSRDSQTSRRMSGSPLQSRGGAQAEAERDEPSQQETSSAAPRHVRYPSFVSPVRRSKELSAERNRSPSRHSSVSSMHITPPSDGALSWVEREGPISPNLRGDNSLREAAGLPERETEMEESSVERGLSPGVEVTEAEPPRESPPVAEEEQETGQDDRDDETDIWELEARRETPRSVRQQPFGKRVATSNNRRGAIPSPWTKRSVHRPGISRMISQAVPDLSHLTEEPSVVPDHAPLSSSPDEYTRLAQSQKEEAAAKKTTHHPGSAAEPAKLDLSSFFSSPAVIPGLLAQKFMPAAAKPANPAMSMAGQAPPVVPTSSMFPQIAQQHSRPDNISDESSLFSPAQRRQSSAPQQEASREQQQQQQQQQQQPNSPDSSPSPTTPEQAPMPTIVQKQNFTPRPGQTSSSFFHPSTNPSTAATPPRMQLSRADIHRWTQQTSNASEASPDFQRPLLRPLPPKNASPTKSSLRSPLKPHTPGRVVEFTSSVLSPAEQAKARLDNRSSARSSSLFSQGFLAPRPVVQDDKENASASDISMDEAPPLTKPSLPGPLSQTIWSRRHWLLLDHLLQRRRASPFQIRYTRYADGYLGKTVKSHGEAMTLDRWHLDVVDAFKAEVGGWDEGVLAKRLFALILGEARRTEARDVETVMFH